MSINILIADDSQTIVKLLSATLSREGYSTESCSNGLEALNLLKKKNPHFDLVISDETMPHILGSQLAYYMRDDSEYKDTPIILVSAEHNDSFFGKLVRDKIINCYQPKPFRIKPLVNMIHILLKQSHKLKTSQL